MICVYAIAARGARPAVRGINREPLRSIAVGTVAAIVGDLKRPPAPSPANLKQYDAAVRRMAERLPSILPARFGTCLESPDELRIVLETRQEALGEALRRVRHRVQMTVRVVEASGAGGAGRGSGVGEAGGGGGASGARGATGVGRGRAYLRERAERAARERQIPGFDPVRAAVARWVRDERVEKRSGVSTVYHLVPRSSAAAYQRALSSAADASGLRLIVTGPWPPYAFASL